MAAISDRRVFLTVRFSGYFHFLYSRLLRAYLHSFNLAVLHGCSRLAKSSLAGVCAIRQKGVLLGTHRQHDGFLVGSSRLGDSSGATTRGQSYLAIRNYFIAHCRNSSQQQPRSSFPKTSTLAQHSRSFAVATSHTTELTPEEEEWVHNGEILALTPSSGPGPRFDWRKRVAASCKPRAGEEVRRVKRIMPPYISVRPGQPFYDEIKAYSNRCVIFLTGVHLRTFLTVVC